MSLNISFLKEKGNKYVVFILLGILLLVICMPTNSSNDMVAEQSTNVEEGELQKQLRNVLSAMEGVGDVEVMITTESQGSTLFENQGSDWKVQGVVVVAEGAGNALVEARIKDAVKALFSLDVHKISIVKMRSQEGDK